MKVCNYTFIWENWTRKFVMMEEDDEGEMQATTSEPEQLPRSTWSSNESILHYMTQIFPGRRWLSPSSLSCNVNWLPNGGLEIPMKEYLRIHLFRTHYAITSNLLRLEPNDSWQKNAAKSSVEWYQWTLETSKCPMQVGILKEHHHASLFRTHYAITSNLLWFEPNR